MFSKAFVLVAGATSAYAACSLTPGAGTINLAGNSVVSPDGTDARTPTKGVPFTIMYDGRGLGSTLDFVLLKGPGNNIIAQGYIATGVANCGTATCTLSWTPDCSLEDTAGLFNGYGIRMDDETSCSYQYTTQFGIKAGDVCGSKPSSVAPPPASSEAPKPSGSAAPKPSESGSHPKPSDKPDSGKPDSGKPDHGKPDSGKPDSGKPDSGKPDSGKPGSGSGGYGGSGSGSGSGSYGSGSGSSGSSSGSYGSGSGSSSSGSYGSSGSSGSWAPPSNGTSYQPPSGASNTTKPTYTPVYSNNASGQFAVNAIGAIVALAASVMLL